MIKLFINQQSSVHKSILHKKLYMGEIMTILNEVSTDYFGAKCSNLQNRKKSNGA